MLTPLHGPAARRRAKAPPGPVKGAARQAPAATAHCACGGGCPDCKAQDAQLERQADAMADRMTETTGPPTGIGPPPPVPPEDFHAKLSDELTGGVPLDASLRDDFEPALGRKLDRLGIHDNPAAHALARDMKARAFALGPHLFFGANQYNPATGEGRRLIAHEIAHTAQPGAALTIRRAPELSTPAAEPETEPEAEAEPATEAKAESDSHPLPNPLPNRRRSRSPFRAPT